MPSFCHFPRTIRFIRLACLWALCGLAFSLPAETPAQEDVNRLDPNFVKASLLEIGPGATLYSAAGHSCFRMECPTYNLDLCFSYESENAADRVFSFLAGDLKMGMFAIPTAEFLKNYAAEGRSVRQYELNLSPAAKQRLWKILDDAVAQGAELSYDFIRRGCAQSALHYLREAARPSALVVPSWPAKYDKTLRELFSDALLESPWQCFFVLLLVGTDADANFPKMKRVIIPRDLVEFLKKATIDGKPAIAAAATQLLPPTREPVRPFFTPPMAAILVVLLAVLELFVPSLWVQGLFLAFQAILGVFLIYLVFVSSLPATTWNWLLIPFNPLPLVFWKWRAKWRTSFALVILAWLASMLCAPHALTDVALLILAGGYAVFFLSPFLRRKFNLVRTNTERKQ